MLFLKTQKEQECVRSARDWLDNREPALGDSLRASEPGTEELVEVTSAGTVHW